MTQTLKQALKHARDTRWRTNDSAYAQASIAAMHVAQASLGSLTHWGTPTSAVEIGRAEMPEVEAGRIAENHVRDATAMWYRSGLSPATINKRLSCLSVLGVNIPEYVKDPPRLKWWLRPEEEARAIAWLTSPAAIRGAPGHTLADLIVWTTRTGLRIEESLRLTWDNVSPVHKVMMVPGLKTASSQATLPLGEDAVTLLKDRWAAEPELMEGHIFGHSYMVLEGEWRKLRKAMGWTGNGVTMKALRRSAARYLHVDCGMPLDMVRHYLRHENIETTMGYLRLTGGYGTDEMRRYLK